MSLLLPHHQDELQQWADAGLIIPSPSRAEHFLAMVGSYRLSTYAQSFMIDDRFISGVTFDEVAQLYSFDRKLRLTLLDALERVEVALRSCISDLLYTRTQDPYWYLDARYWKPEYDHKRLLRDIKKELHHHVSDPQFPPSWIAFHTLSFGALQKLFFHLHKEDQRMIAQFFEIEPRFLDSWSYALVLLRNHCAHHARIWNRHFHIRLSLHPRQLSYIRGSIDASNHGIVDGYILILDALMQRVSPESRWWLHLSALWNNYYDASVHPIHQAQLRRYGKHPLGLF